MQSGLERVRVVLVRPRAAGNVGAAARAMKNCGATDLAVVRPRARLAAAERMAVHARDLVRGARVTDDVAAAVADCALVVGTTSRAGGYRATAEDLAALAPVLLAQAATAPVAVLFGPEDHGLSNTDLRHCQRLCSIDTSDAYPSLNLAQAVLLNGYEWFKTTGGEPPFRENNPSPPAKREMILSMFDYLEAELDTCGFFPAGKKPVMTANLRDILHRLDMTEQEARTLRGVFKSLVEGPKKARLLARQANEADGAEG